MPNAPTLEMLDARLWRGTYLVATRSGTHYYVEVCKSVAGAMRVISDGLVIKMVREGVVGGCGCPNDEPTIRVGESMHLAARGQHIVMTSPVAQIEKYDGVLDSLVCSHCKRGYKSNDQTCSLCHN